MNYQSNYLNQGYGMYGMNPMQPQMQRFQPVEQQYPQYTPPQTIYKQPMGLQGKSVDSIDVVKAMDIPLDGTISYFPLTNGTAIVTKQLQQDGTSKTIVYEPVNEEKKEQVPQYVTGEELSKQVNIITQNNKILKDGVNDIRTQIEELSDNIKELSNEMKSFKGGKK